MKLAISNIGWTAEYDAVVYDWMKAYGYSGLEIAPTRIFPDQPYHRKNEAKLWREAIKQTYGFCIPSMQSIWFGKQEKLFGTDEERTVLSNYTKEAIAFAAAIDCKNLVFGCPRNRNRPKGADEKEAISFFREMGDFAAKMGTVIGMEANPEIYHTNYINDTSSALELIQMVQSKGFLLNLDVGTMLCKGERVSELIGKVHLIHHVHISEPGLMPIQKRDFHQELCEVLRSGGYTGFISIEMGKVDDITVLDKTMQYVSSIFLNDGI